MTALAIELPVNSDDRQVARYAAAAIVLTIAEAALPSPLPGVKPGLANIIVLIALMRQGWAVAVWVSLLRVVAGGIMLGQFLAPGFFLSLAGALCSLIVLAFMQKLPRFWFGAVSLSLVSSFAHVGGQLLLARWWLVPHEGLWRMAPVFAAAALVFGLVNGLIAAHFLAGDKTIMADNAL